MSGGGGERVKKAVMYGSGNIGRGFIGRLFSDSGYEVVFLSRRLTELLSQRGGYTVRSVGNEGATEKRVAPVRAVAAGSDGAVAEIASCDVMATAVGVRNLADIAPWIARGVAARMRASGGPLDILLCENLMDASAFMRREIYRGLDGAQRDWAEKNLGLVEVSVGCIVPQMDAEAARRDPLLVCAEPFDILPVDRDAFRGPIPDIHGLIPFSPFEYCIDRKLYVHNCAHAVCAYLGYVRGHATIWEAITDARVERDVRAAMTAGATALARKFPGLGWESVEENVSGFLERLHNRALGDTVARVGADPLRKLRRDDRIVGAALFCQEQGVDPAPIHTPREGRAKYSSGMYLLLAPAGRKFQPTSFWGAKPNRSTVPMGFVQNTRSICFGTSTLRPPMSMISRTSPREWPLLHPASDPTLPTHAAAPATKRANSLLVMHRPVFICHTFPRLFLRS